MVVNINILYTSTNFIFVMQNPPAQEVQTKKAIAF